MPGTERASCVTFVLPFLLPIQKYNQKSEIAIFTLGWCPQLHNYFLFSHYFWHITVTLVVIILLTWLFFILLYLFLSMTWSLLNKFLLFWGLCSSLHSICLWANCFSAVFMFFMLWFFVTVLAWTRGWSHSCVNIFFFHFGGFRKKNSLYCFAIVLFEMVSLSSFWSVSPLNLHHRWTICISLSLLFILIWKQNNQGSLKGKHGVNHFVFSVSIIYQQKGKGLLVPQKNI